jgi:hypothetical protein
MNERINAMISGLDRLLLDSERLMLDVSNCRSLCNCRCGCHGDYTEHTMRAGESGRRASIIIQD